MLQRYPKIFSVGDRHIPKLFDGEVEITEKVDGSQFVFGRIGGELMCRSKGAVIIMDAPEKMFSEAVEYIKSIEEKIPDGSVFYAEYLKKPKHNTLAYDRIPKNHLSLFGHSQNGYFFTYDTIKIEAKTLEIDVVPIIFKGKISDPQEIFPMIEKVSFLGGQNIEGIVVKNYAHEYMIADRLYPLMVGKYVSEKFKEVHGNTWKSENTGKGKWDITCESYRSEARWMKAVQHLKEDGRLTQSPRDIGELIKEVKRDISEEEIDNIKDILWKLYGSGLLRKSVAGLPEWYKDELVKGNV